MQHERLPEIMTLTELRYKATTAVKILERGQSIVVMKRGKKIALMYPYQKLANQTMDAKINLPTFKLGIKENDIKRENIYKNAI